MNIELRGKVSEQISKISINQNNKDYIYILTGIAEFECRGENKEEWSRDNELKFEIYKK